MNAREKKEQIFQRLSKIKDKVRKQFPIVPNHFEQFERIPIDPTLEDMEKLPIIEAVDEKYFEHELRFGHAKTTHAIYKQLNEFFAEYIKDNNIRELNDQHRATLRSLLPLQAQTLYQKMKRRYKSMPEVRCPDISSLQSFLTEHAPMIADKLVKGEKLKLEDKDFAERMELFDQLQAMRDRHQAQMVQNLNVSFFDGKVQEKLEKLSHLTDGLFIKKENARVGLCGEHVSLSVLFMTKKNLIHHYGIHFEIILINYADEEDKRDDNHVFIAVNRDPSSKLNDISSWGEKAILFDAWNDLLCYAEDYKKLPLHYVAYEPGAKWKVATTFNEDDKYISHAITLQDRDYFMTGTNVLEKRIPLIMEEYQLSSLNQPATENTSAYLYQLAKDMRPKNFDFEPDIFISTEYGEYIRVIPGFAEPKLAVHNHFTDCTHEEMQFAMAQALVNMQHNWAGMANQVSSAEQFSVDRQAVEISQNGAAAISYLRKSIEFEKKEEKEHKARLLPLNFVHDRIHSSSPAEQIKALMTLFALDEYQYMNTKEKEDIKTAIAEPIKEEMGKIIPLVYFEEGFKKAHGKVAKINYLATCLPVLKKELIPYELHYRSLSIYARHFCRLLRSLNINFKNEKEHLATNKLIQRAYELRVPGFEEIYYAAHSDTYGGPDDKREMLYPLGPFLKLQNAVTQFIRAANVNDAEKTASKIKKLREELKPHFEYHGIEGNDFTEGFQKKHQGRLPTGNERYFGSAIGNHIQWKGFVAEREFALPWEKHMAFAKKNVRIAKTLWDLGVRNYRPLWEVVPSKELLKMNAFMARQFIRLSGSLSDKYGYYSWIDKNRHSLKQALHYLADQHPLVTAMFDGISDFRTAFLAFYHKNWRKLVYPQILKKSDLDDKKCVELNADNEATRFLLKKFGEIALTGTEEEKQIIKEFFTNHKDQPGLWQLRTWGGELNSDYLKVVSPYIGFLINQTHDGKPFQLFTSKELLAFLHTEEGYRCYVEYYKFPIQTYLKLYELPFERVTIECLEAIHPLIKNMKLRHDYFDKIVNHYFKHNKHHAFSPEMIRLLPFAEEAMHSCCFHLYSDKLHWDLPEKVGYFLESMKLNNKTSLKDAVYIYRFYDNRFTFPNERTKQAYGKLILEEILLLDDKFSQIKLLEGLLLQDEFNFPLTDMQLRPFVMNAWVSTVAAHYGRDDGSKEYQEKLLPIIKRVLAHATKRDTTIMLEKLAVAIESQWGISEFLGERLEAEKFIKLSTKKEMDGVTQLSLASKYFSETPEDQHQFLDFISAPLTEESLIRFCVYIEEHKRTDDFIQRIEPSYRLRRDREGLRMVLIGIYFVFWDLTIEQRAVIIDHVIIPSSKVHTDSLIKMSYQEGFDYIARKLLPKAEDESSDDHFAYALIKAYLNTADKYIRGILLSGMLVATNEVSHSNGTITAGKKIAMLCEHMGPAYIKLAQAVHSHPSTPEQIRRDLDHVKGRAHPPYRWQLWRLASEVLSKAEFDSIKRIGKLLGSASYNLALELEVLSSSTESSMAADSSLRGAPFATKQPRNTAGKSWVASSQKALLAMTSPLPSTNPPSTNPPTTGPGTKPQNECMVLLLLRENAKHDAEKGFKHLRETVLACDHPRMLAARDAALSIIDEAEKLSQAEMDKDMSEQQYKIAANVYKNLKYKEGQYEITMSPVALFSNGYGYRFIERVYGEEFNNLPSSTPEEKNIKAAVAAAVVRTELVNILRGSYFDSDRHGNQLRVDVKNNKIHIGLYDFGEMSLKEPSDIEIKQFAKLISVFVERIKEDKSSGAIIESLLSEHIDIAQKVKEPTRYLMRIRKAFLALQDFQKELPNEKLISMIKNIVLRDDIHPILCASLMASMGKVVLSDAVDSISSNVSSFFSRFGQSEPRPSGSAVKSTPPPVLLTTPNGKQ